jgi:hypothetical protein
MKAQDPSTSLGEGRDVAPSLAHPSQKQNLVVYTEELTHLRSSDHKLQFSLILSGSFFGRAFALTLP